MLKARLENSVILKAIHIASHAHKNQKRKYTEEPYFVHLSEVAEIVRMAGGSDDMIAAAYLHDTVEDTHVTLSDIEQEFGQHIMSLVEMVTDISRPSDGNREKRKHLDLVHLSNASPEGQTIKLADIISNTSTICKYDPDFAKVYIREKEKLLPHLSKGDLNLFKAACDIIYDEFLKMNLGEENARS